LVKDNKEILVAMIDYLCKDDADVNIIKTPTTTK
jgi:hypothetical protein